MSAWYRSDRTLPRLAAALATAGLFATTAGGQTNGPIPTVEVYAQTGSRSYKPGQEVELILKATNPGPGDVALRFASAQQFDFVISDHGRPIWRWSDGRMFAQIITDLPLRAGESKIYRARWAQVDRDGRPVAPNTYELTARLTTLPAFEGHTRIEIH